jgi:hypothetical protein
VERVDLETDLGLVNVGGPDPEEVEDGVKALRKRKKRTRDTRDTRDTRGVITGEGQGEEE